MSPQAHAEITVEPHLSWFLGMSRSLLKIAKRSLRLETYAASAI
jgi:hypothetical protein